MVSNPQTEKLIDKIARVLELARHPDTPQKEAEAAFATANRMFLKHNIDILQVDNVINKSVIVEEKIAVRQNRSEGIWEPSLSVVISENTFCRGIASGKNTLYVIGRRDNVDAMIYMFRAAREIYRAKAVEAWKGATANMSRGVFIRSFLLGCTVGLNQKLIEERRREEASRDQFALVLADTDQENQEFIDDNYQVVQRKKSRGIRVNDASTMGKTCGRTTSLPKALPETS